MAKKPKYGAWSHLMGLREKGSPKVEQQIKDNARGATSPLGGLAKGSLAKPLKKGKR